MDNACRLSIVVRCGTFGGVSADLRASERNTTVDEATHKESVVCVCSVQCCVATTTAAPSLCVRSFSLSALRVSAMEDKITLSPPPPSFPTAAAGSNLHTLKVL